MYQAASRRPPTSEAWVRCDASRREIYGVQSGTGNRFFSEYVGFPLSVSYHQRSVIIFIYMLL
jgi:hypothetical protein